MSIKQMYEWCVTPITAKPWQWGFYRLPWIVFGIDFFLSIVSVLLLSSVDLIDEAEEIGVDILAWSFIPFLILISLFEELFFRILPLGVVMRVTNRRGIYLATALISAVVFGYIHGGVAHIFVQGLGGFIYGVLFIKYADNGRRLFTASILVVALHSMFNGLIALILLLAGETVF